MVIKIGGQKRWLWRAVDDEGVVLDMLVQRRRNKKAALRLICKLMKNTRVQPETITTDKLASHGAALRERINTALRIPRTADVKVPLSPVRPLGGGSCFSVAARVGVEAALVGAQR